MNIENNEEQVEMFEDTGYNWENEWKDMPEYKNVKQPEPKITALFKFRNEKDYIEFKELVKLHIYNNEKVFDGMQQIDKKQSWYPLKEKASKYLYVDVENEK